MLYYIIGNSKSKYYGVVITGHVLARLFSFGSAHLYLRQRRSPLTHSPFVCFGDEIALDRTAF